MSEEVKTTPTTKTIAERIAERQKLPTVVTKEIPGFGPVVFRRVGPMEAFGFKEKLDAVVKTLVDENGAPVFASAEDLRARLANDQALFWALYRAYDEANSLEGELEAARKK